MFFPQEMNRQKILQLISTNPLLLSGIPRQDLDYEYCLAAISAPLEAIPCRSHKLLIYVPTEFRTEELCKIAVCRHSHNLGDVPAKYITYEMCLNSVKQCGERLCDVPTQFMTEEILIIAMQRYHHLLYRSNWELWVRGKIGESGTRQIVEKLRSFTAKEFEAEPFSPGCKKRGCTSTFEQCRSFVKEMTESE